MASKLFLIDGSGFIFRAFHALPPLKRPDGTPVGAVYGFCNMLLKIMEEAKKDHGANALAVIFDAGRQTFRQNIYPDYKAHRPEVPEDLIPQFSLIREACHAFNIPSIELEGFEADDLIATYAREARNHHQDVVIVSSDKDLMQLVREGVSLLDPLKNKPIGPVEVLEKFGVTPDKVVDVQALAGDASDNVPGVPGIGIKTAADLINTYGSLEMLLEKAFEIKQPKRRQTLIDFAEQARLSKKLVLLEDQAPLPLDLEKLPVKEPNHLTLIDFLKEQGFNSLVARLSRQTIPQQGELFSTTSSSPKTPYITVQTKADLEKWVKEALSKAVIAIDCETNSLSAVQADLVGISLATEEGRACYIPVDHKTGEQQLDRTIVLETLAPLLTDESVLKVGHNFKYDLTVFQNYGVDIYPLSDTLLMSYVLDGGKHGHSMDELAERHLGYQTIKFSDVAGTGKNQKTFDYVPLSHATTYAAEDADVTFRFYQLFRKRLLDEKMLTVYERIERPLVPIISLMERTGIIVDSNHLHSLGKSFGAQMSTLETEIYKLAGREFNIGSPKQLGELLFDSLGLPAPKKTKTGAYVTDADVLENLASQGHEIPQKVLEWRGLAKLKSTYVDGLMAAINPKTGRVHTSYSLSGTSTGRLSSSDPNLQNIPIRTENGRKIRQAFISDPGYKIVSLDYSQIELRLLAHMAHVPTLAKSFIDGLDIHTATASEMFGIPIDKITSLDRRRAKAINFGIIYGISAFGLSQQLGIPQSEASAYIKKYFERYPGIQDYMEDCKKFARSHGYVKTLFGRKCYTPSIADKNPIARQFSERQAINAPLQGSNADIIKIAMARIPEALAQKGLQGKLLLQVHDELVFEIPENEIEESIPLLKNLMQGVVSLKVPLVVEAGIGNNWDEAH